MKNNKKKLSGQSIVEILIGAAIVLGGAAIVGTLTVQYQSINKKAEVKSASSSFAGDLASLGRKMFLTTIDTSGKNTQGLCAFMGTTGTSGGVSRIFINIPKADGVLASTWKAAIEGSTWMPPPTGVVEFTCSGAASDFNKCFIHKLYQGNTKDPKTQEIIRNQKVVGSMKIIPQYLQEGKEKGFLFTDLEETRRGSNLDVKRVAFLIKTKVTTFPSGDSSSSGQSATPITEEAESLVWGADSGGCDKTINNVSLKLAPSGSGQGDPLGRTIYNETSYVFKETLPFTGSWEKRVIQAGTFEDGLVRTKAEENIEMSCNETRFTCNNDTSSSRKFASEIEANYFLTYNDKTSTVTNRDGSVRFIPWLSFDNTERGSLEVSRDDLRLKFDGTSFIYNSKNNFYNTPDLKFQMRATGGSHELYFYANNDTTNVCSKICSAEDTGIYTPTLHYSLPDFKDSKGKTYEGTLSTSSAVGCTVCYMKDCKRYGLKTFGPLRGGRGVIAQPDEPLDGTLPECAVKSDSDVDSLVMKLNNYSATPGESCISAKVEDQANGVFSYQKQSCTSSLPLMCFAYGKFTLAKKVSTSGTSHESLPQKSGALRCYQMGREVFDKNKLKGLVAQSYTNNDEIKNVSTVVDSIPGSPTASIINNAVQGIFLAPQSERQRRYAAEWLGLNHSKVMSNPFWIGLRSDSMGNIYSEIPWGSSLTATENKIENQYSIFFNTNSQLAVVRHEKDLRALKILDPSGSGSGALISHHVRYKGVFPAKAEQSSDFSFVCRKKAAPYRFFISSEKSSKQSDGPSICSKASGWFIPPVTSLQWTKVFHLLTQNHFNYSFPDPNGELNFAWVALSGDGSTNTEAWKVFSGGDLELLNASISKSTLKQIYRNGEEVATLSENSSTSSSSLSSDNAVSDSEKETPKDSEKETPKIESAYACFKTDGTIILDSQSNACKGIGTKLNRNEMRSYVVQALWLLDSDDSKEKGILLDD